MRPRLPRSCSPPKPSSRRLAGRLRAHTHESRPTMTNTRTLVLAALVALLLTYRVGGQELTKYRAFELGSRLDAVLTVIKVPVKEVTTVHQRPALMQNVEWRPSRWTPGSSIASTDPVDQIRFSFYD